MAFTIHSAVRVQGSVMRAFVLSFGLICLSMQAQAQDGCIGASEMRDLVAQKHVIAPSAAMAAAKSAVPGADMLRANLCRQDSALIYQIVTLRPDGKVVQIIVNGTSGRVESIR